MAGLPILMTCLVLGECLALLVVGHLLVRSRAFSPLDGQVLFRVAENVTFPALVLQVLFRLEVEAMSVLGLALAGLVWALASSAIAWLATWRHAPRDRSVVSASVVSLSLAGLTFPVIAKVAGTYALAIAVVFGTAYFMVGKLMSLVFLSSGGSAYPAEYRHADGGVYIGEWKGVTKHGLGYYRYPSGASYKGEWRDNVKEGYGVYVFKDGSTYEGEWVNGQRDGMGVRTFSSGKVKAGRWREGEMEKQLQLWQCARAAEASCVVAEQATSGETRPHGAGLYLKALLLEPVLWALMIGYWHFWSNAGGGSLYLLHGPLDTLTSSLAQAHIPLSLLAFGMTIDHRRPTFRQMKDVSLIFALRVVPALGLACCLCVLRPHMAPMVAIASLCIISPISRMVSSGSALFQSNEALALAGTRLSELAAILVVSLLVIAAGISWPNAFCPWLHLAAHERSNGVMLQCTVSASVAVVAVIAAIWFQLALAPSRRQPMVYRPGKPGVASTPDGLELQDDNSVADPPQDTSKPNKGQPPQAFSYSYRHVHIERPPINPFKRPARGPRAFSIGPGLRPFRVSPRSQSQLLLTRML